jgi:hypothetical protein
MHARYDHVFAFQRSLMPAEGLVHIEGNGGADPGPSTPFSGFVFWLLRRLQFD